MLISSTSWLLIFSAVGCAVLGAPTSRSNACQSFHTDFSQGLSSSWSEEHGSKDDWKVTSDGIVMTLTKPPGFKPEIDPSTREYLPINSELAPISPTFVSSTMLQYGKVTYEIKAADTPGAVTAAILMSPEGDEIDFEVLGGGTNTVQTNYFYGSTPVYNINEQAASIGGASTSFHSYTIDWYVSIKFYIDGNLVRTVLNTDNCNGSNSACNFPTHAAYIKFGLWDASSPAYTAQWARGPINWDSTQSVSATIKSVTVECSSN
ncbi:concanavalin A-like lectin/glucanase domain-containing protein [Blakeslea trispora]|nr:concanavalin A-like lectin/glucanase domain-containing protein [Blakeslea trispora]